MARSGSPRRSKASQFGDEGRGRRGTPRGSETEGSRIATNSTRVTNATDLAKKGWRPNAIEASGSGRRPEDILVYVERSRGRADGPIAKVSQPRQIGRTLTRHGTNGIWRNHEGGTKAQVQTSCMPFHLPRRQRTSDPAQIMTT